MLTEKEARISACVERYYFVSGKRRFLGRILRSQSHSRRREKQTY